MPKGKLLDDALLRSVHEAAVNAGLDPRVLTSTLTPELAASFGDASDPRTQIWRDLTELNRLELLDDGPRPLQSWLETARHLAGPRAETAVFQKALDALLAPPGRGPRPPGPPPASVEVAAPTASPLQSPLQPPRFGPSPPAARPATSKPATADVVLLTALKEEYDEARKVGEGAADDWTVDQSRLGFEVAFRSFRTRAGGSLRVALTWAPRMRTATTADRAGQLADELRASCIAMSGVCAGRRGKVQPGDVILGSLLYTYDTGAVVVEQDPEGTRHERFQAEPTPYPLNEHWLHRAQAFQPDLQAAWVGERPPTLAAQCDWVLEQLRQGKIPLDDPERKRRCPSWKEALDRLRKLGFVTPRAPLAATDPGLQHIEDVLLDHEGALPLPPPFRVHVAPIATGNNVMRDPRLFDKLSSSMRTVLGVEMEASAIAAVAHARGLRWIVMKGVMDHADADKDDQLKPFAARASAECLISFLRESWATGGERGDGPPPPSDPPRREPDPPSDPFSAGAHTADLAKLRGRLEVSLRAAPALTSALGGCSLCANIPRTPERIAQRLMDCTGLHVATALASLAVGPDLRSAARDLLWILLPLAGDWEDLLRQDRISAANADLELRLRSETIAEIAVARVEARPCLFAPGTGYPEGALHIPYPAVGAAPFFDESGEGVAKAVVHNLWRERGPEERLPGRARWDDVKRGVLNEEEFFTQVAAEIEVGSAQERRPYLLFIDAMLDTHAGDLEAWWERCRKQLRKALPGLRLVRLKTRMLTREEALLRTVVRDAVKLP